MNRMNMTRGLIAALLVAGAALSGTASACSCAFDLLDTEQARSVEHVFVFRLMSARADKWPRVVGTIQVLANVRGRTEVREIGYSTYHCCGSRFEVGKDYIGFLPAGALPAGKDSFEANAGNVLPLMFGFDRDVAGRLEAVLRGKGHLEDDFSYGMDEINQMRPPPPPCPEAR